MSAVDEYRKRAETYIEMRGDLKLADASIAELKAELATLKGRRCGSCRYMGACDQRMNMLGNVIMTVGYCSCWAERETE